MRTFKMDLFERLSLWFIFPALFTLADSLPYDVHWLGGATIIDRDVPAPKQQAVDIYCYPGTSKNLFALWQTVKFHVRIRNGEFRQYFGNNPEEVYKEYTEDYGWPVVNPFQKKAQKTTSLSLFTPTCMAINTKQRHSIELQIIRVDIWRIILMFLGISLIMSSRALSGNPVFFYLCGIFVGVSASFMVLVYYISKLLPGRRTLTYGILIGGWTVGVYVFQQVWENIRTILLTYQTHMFWYVLVMSFISFLVCYRIGPPRNQRSKNLVMWTLQAVGVLMVFFSSDYQDAAGAVIIMTLLIKYFPQSLRHRIQGYWRRRFPPKPRLLSNEEYYEEGARETKQALENLRKYCSSPDCAQWSIMLKLNDSRRSGSSPCPAQRSSDSNPRPARGGSNLTPRLALGESDSTPRSRQGWSDSDPRRSDSTPSGVRGRSDSIRRSVRGRSNSSRGRFASFVEGNSHLSDDEILNYESYAFSMDRSRKPTPVANSTRNGHEISDDDSSEYEDS